RQPGDVAGQGSYTGTLTTQLPIVPEGDYHVIVVVDSQGLVPDSNRANNVAVSAGTIHLTVPHFVRIVGNNPPAGLTEQDLTSVTLQFSKAIVQSSFTMNQVALTGPGGAIAVSSIQKIDDTHYQVQFADQSTR